MSSGNLLETCRRRNIYPPWPQEDRKNYQNKFFSFFDVFSVLRDFADAIQQLSLLLLYVGCSWETEVIFLFTGTWF